MCGIFGVLAVPSAVPPERVEAIVDRLVLESESRGREAAGVAVVGDDRIHVFKQATAGSTMIRSPRYRALMRRALPRGERPSLVIGHSRLVTHGGQCLPRNNQPVVAGGMTGIHNGIIVNHDALTASRSLQRESELDTEVALRLVRRHRDDGATAVEAVRRTFEAIDGVANVALLFEDLAGLVLATNNGSIYLGRLGSGSGYVFASEAHVLRRLASSRGMPRVVRALEIEPLDASHGVAFGSDVASPERFPLRDSGAPGPRLAPRSAPLPITTHEPDPEDAAAVASSLAPETRTERAPAWFDEAFEARAERVAALRRCTRCVVPVTLPFSGLDDEATCAYCRHHEPQAYRGDDALERHVAPHRRSDGRPDCVVPLSGGRDSCWALHYLTRELGLRPVAYTYDWGMVTDLARRNSSRLCGRLGVEHVIVSADIARKRRYIRSNVEAWLRRPALGTVPLFMAGDKQFFYYAEQLRKQTETELLVFSMNPLERTDFKHGFCGISGGGHGEHFFRLSMLGNLQIALYYGKEYLLNPAYLNRSLWDTLFAYFAYFLMPHRYTQLYHYVPWDEAEIERTLLGEYDWETAPDTESTWRIGDGTASFYNYIYYMVAGFTENDTFRSNQVREGTIDRDEALRLTERDNRPRYDSIRWYCDTVGLDFERTIRTINAVTPIEPP